jgi:hypothetical protein
VLRLGMLTHTNHGLLQSSTASKGSVDPLVQAFGGRQRVCGSSLTCDIRVFDVARHIFQRVIVPIDLQDPQFLCRFFGN